MAHRPTLPWSELRELHVVRTAAKLVERRWGLGLGFADWSPLVRPPRPPAGLSLCSEVQSRERGEQACREHGQRALVQLGERAAAAADDPARVLAAADPGRADCAVCHAGLTEIAAPLVVDGEICGALLCGGLTAETSDHERRTVEMLLEEVAQAVVREMGPQLRSAARPSELASEYLTRYSYDAIVGRSPPMQDLYRLLDRVVQSDSTVLIQGENGTGKELVARAIHYNSGRKHQRFVVQNCSAFNDNLLDSELFGHKRGAFTGAIADKPGLFEVADGGTFFLDEIGDMSPALQVKVLRVLQEGTFTAVGDTEPRQVDVRIIAATNRDLKSMVEQGLFREDLYYRIHVIQMVIPPLRQREPDIDLLCETFLKKHGRGRRVKQLSAECRARMAAYGWPGNVRELENEIERLLVLSGEERVIDEALLSPRIREGSESGAGAGIGSAGDGAGGGDGAAGGPNGGLGGAAAAVDPANLPAAIEALERRMIGDALTRHNGNKTRAAAELGISRRNIIRLAQKYQL